MVLTGFVGSFTSQIKINGLNWIAHTKKYKKDKYPITPLKYCRPLKVKNCYLVSGSGVVGVGVTLRGGGGTIGGWSLSGVIL